MPIYDNNSLATDLQLTALIGLEPALKFIEIMTNTINHQLKLGNKVCTDLGNFNNVRIKKKKVMDKQTKESITTPSSIEVNFKASKQLTKSLNE